MSEPLKKQQELSTADLVKQANPGPAQPGGPQLVDRPQAGTENAAPGPLFDPHEAQQLHERWSAVQTAFVDDPRVAVQQADTLVASTMKRLAEIFAQERAQVESQWSRGDQVSTEELRQAFRRYRSFFDRLLHV